MLLFFVTLSVQRPRQETVLSHHVNTQCQHESTVLSASLVVRADCLS